MSSGGHSQLQVEAWVLVSERFTGYLFYHRLRQPLSGDGVVDAGLTVLFAILSHHISIG